MARKFAHCMYCGHRYGEDQPWPRTCAACHQVSYRNPLPVSVVLVPVADGVLTIRRAIDPQLGKLALPGGYVNWNESWQQAGARELREETGLNIEPAELTALAVHSAPDGTLLVFGLARPRALGDLPTFVPTDETSEHRIVSAPTELAFALHTRVLADYFARRPPLQP